jgi:cellulose synthase/poly-beta-1,6-N-acetylglucosamine synthase-like glycosyltransferase
VNLALFWLPVLLLGWVYVGYPIAAWAVGRIRPFVVQLVLPAPKRITVAIAAYNEARHLQERVRNILEQKVDADLDIIVALDGSTDTSGQILDQLAASDPRLTYIALPRSGKTAALNAIFGAARGELVVLTDAETRFAPGCLAEIAAAFRDPRVGCATGRIVWQEPGQTPTSRNEGIYWRYEQLVRALESRAGWLAAGTGALLAVRRELHRRVPDHADMDHLLPLYAREQGLVVMTVPTAVAVDRPIAGLRAQFRNRTRTATRGIAANLAMAPLLSPWRRPSAFLAIWSHKLLRWGTPWLVGLLALGAALLVAEGELFYLLPLGALVVFGLLAVLGYGLRRVGIAPLVTSFPLAFAVVNLAFVIGWLNLIRGNRIQAWRREEWQTQSQRQ